ncbi:MAG: COG4223 family protein [Pararhodobacter sp.]
MAKTGTESERPAATSPHDGDAAGESPTTAAPGEETTTAEPDQTDPPEQPQDAPAERLDGAEPLDATENTPDVEQTPVSDGKQSRNGGALALIGGGVLAALIGAGAVLVFLPQGWDSTGRQVLESRLEALESAMQSADTRLEAAMAPLLARFDTIDTRLATFDPETLERRLAAAEARRESSTDAAALEALEALEARLAGFEARIDARIEATVTAAMADMREAQAERAEALATTRDEIDAAESRLAAHAALATLVAAAETGAPAADALATLGETFDLPAALLPMAGGLPSLRALQQGFPGAARRALAAAPLPADAPPTERLLGFLRAQTGARALAPREGDDTNAILSRAEALLRGGDLAGSLAELDALPDGPAAEMAPWRAQARTRLGALDALNTLHAQLTAQ